ncbi:heat shock protein HtpX, partial [Acidithiobacillus sp. GGI-221]
MSGADLLWALLIGFGGAFISLLMSKHLARAGLQMQPMRRNRPRNIWYTIQWRSSP